MALIVGVKHYPRTLKNIDDRISDLDYLRRFLNLSAKPEAKRMQGIIDRALKRYNEINDIIYRLLRYKVARDARLKRKRGQKNGF